MEEACFLLSVVFLIGGMVFLFAPGHLANLNRWLNTTLLTSDKAVVHRGVAGTAMALLGLLILWLAWRAG
jgi:hypothetical protein